MATAATKTALQPEAERRIAILERPEFREALDALRTQLERLHEEFAPILERALSLPDQADLIEVTDQESLEFADEWARTQVLETKVEAERIGKPWTQFGNVLHKSFVALLKLAVDPCDAAVLKVNRKTIEHHNRVKAEREEAERKARLERERIERERKAEQDRLQKEADEKAAAERKRVEELAREADRQGDTETAEAAREYAQTIESEPVRLAPQPTPLPLFSTPEPAKVKGTAIPDNWKGRLCDPEGESFERLILHVAKDVKARKHVLALDQTAANREAKNHEAELAAIWPGLEAWNDQGVRRGKR
jgi:hypothetical protein